MHNRIEKSAFRPGEYVGHCDGVWRIHRPGRNGVWVASKQDGSDRLHASTLDGIGKALDERANVAVGRLLFRGK